MHRSHNGPRAIAIRIFCKPPGQKVHRAVDCRKDYIQDTWALPCYFSCFSITSVIRASRGNSPKNVEPSPSPPVLSAHKRPPCISTRRRLIGRPKPVPPTLRVVEVST